MPTAEPPSSSSPGRALPDRPPLRVDELGAEPGRWRVEVVASSPSTNVDLAARARTGAKAGTVLVAEHQTAGRGRIDRGFETPDRAAVTFSALLRPRVAPLHWPWLPLLAGLAVRDGVLALHPGIEVSLKWPNDVLVAVAGDERPRKVCGILVERVETPEGPAAVVGIGINATTTAAELPVPTAASLLTAGVGAEEVDRTALLGSVLGALDRLVGAWEAGDLALLRARYAAACDTVGRSVRVELPGDVVLQGRATGIDPDGCLLVDDGSRAHVVSAGDVVHVRPGR